VSQAEETADRAVQQHVVQDQVQEVATARDGPLALQRALHQNGRRRLERRGREVAEPLDEDPLAVGQQLGSLNAERLHDLWRQTPDELAQ
jgi:hypothetical protein